MLPTEEGCQNMNWDLNNERIAAFEKVVSFEQVGSYSVLEAPISR